MRKYTILLIVLCLHIAVRGQTIVKLSDIDLSGLPKPTTAKALRYWFDDDAATVQTSTLLHGSHAADVSGLTSGLHTLHYQVIDENDVAGYVESCLFLNTGGSFGTEGVKAQKLIYWFDDEANVKQINISVGTELIDASTLDEGLHTLHYQVLCSNRQMTPTASTLFLRVSVDETSVTAKSLRYWFDDEQMAVEVEIAEGVQLLDASKLVEGLHTVHYQIANSYGTLGAPASSVFLKIDANMASATAKRIRYWFDDDASTVKVTDVRNGTQTLDVAALSTGLHTLNYQLIDSNGRVSVPVTRFFLKNFDKVLADGYNRVTKYQYWLNRNSEAMQTVELDAAANPYTLIALLPMQKEPIQSSQFHFELTNNVPTIYAKNTLHVRFYDAQNYFTDGQKPFVDYSVKQEVETVGELQKTQTFPKVAENDIRWYTMQVAPGDTAAFKLSQAATLQVFAPSGKEVFKTSESASVQWAGIHTWEDGTYYVAVHDVTGSRSNMTLDYMHMDKYDIVDWDVHTVGNGGCSTITFKGNGFRDLYRVDLYTAAGDSIHSVDISHDSYAETAVTFDFSGAELGIYDAVFHFTQEDKHFANIMTVEEAVDIELATNVSFPSTFLRGTSTTYTIKITNKGNMTAYCVPLELRLRTTSIQDISEVWFSDNLEHFRIPQEIYIDSIDEDVSETLQEALKDFSDLAQFVFYTDSLENISYGLSQLFLNIRPSTTETFTITIRSSSTVYLEAKATDEWVPLTFRDMAYTKAMRIKRKSAGEWMCCNRTKIECVADVVANVAGTFMPPGANCATSLSVTGLEAIYDILCSEGNTASEKFQKYLNSEGKSLARKLLTSAISCVTGYFDKFIFGPLKAKQKTALDNHDLGAYLKIAQEIRDAQKSLRNIISSLGKGVVYGFVGKDCVEAFTKPIPNCPPCTKGCGGGGSSTPQPPADPNDIYGYLSDAGSKFMTDEVAKVNYTIEFENDTAFAQASAHTIVIRDTLDNRYFDLKSFLPTSVKIGYHETFIDEAADVKTAGGVTSFLKTIDMRPEINAIAQVEGEYNQQTGIAKWTFTSLDPMTMEPTDDLMQGILPVNYDGTSGIGEVMFEVGMKPNKGHGTEIKNRASIVFDYEEPILTPTWVNTVDAIRPVSHVSDVQQMNDSTATVRIEATDELSGPWRYDVFVQYGSGAWFKAAENVPADTVAYVKIYEGIEHNFYVLATDSAGNVEVKVPEREFTLAVGDVKPTGDVNGDGKVGIGDIIAVTSYMAGLGGGITLEMADVNGDGKVGIGDIVAVTDIMAGTAKARAKNKNLYKTYFVRRKEKMINEP